MTPRSTQIRRRLPNTLSVIGLSRSCRSEPLARLALQPSGWQFPATEHQQEVLGRAGYGGTGSERPVEVRGAQLDAVEIDAKVLDLLGLKTVEDYA